MRGSTRSEPAEGATVGGVLDDVTLVALTGS